MNTFSKVDGPLSISSTPGGVWKIEKKRKARDRKNKPQKNLKREHSSGEEDEAIFTDIESDNINDKECEDLTGYGLMKKKKPQCTKIDLKI